NEHHSHMLLSCYGDHSRMVRRNHDRGATGLLRAGQIKDMTLDADDARLAAINYVDYSHRPSLSSIAQEYCFICCANAPCSTAPQHQLNTARPVRIILAAGANYPERIRL